MEHLKGIGVSSGLTIGVALVAIQRTQVIRFPVSVDRVARELPRARRVIHDTSAGEMGRIAARVLTLGTVDEIERFLLDAFGRQDIATEVSTP